ncbi:MAG: DUF5667 domain-containing protein, partial [Anaerolineae bacterium]
MSEQHPGYETLARRLDLALPPGARVIPPITQDPLVNTAAQIARLPELALSAEAYRRIEARMLAAFDAQQPRLLPRSQRRTAGILRWALVASLLLVVLWTGLTPTVAGSLPGEPLYSVKLFYERIEFAAATTPAAKASVNLLHADRRAHEALALLDRDRFDSALITQALAHIADAETADAAAWQSASLRGQFRQVETALEFVLLNAQQTGLASEAEITPLSQELEEL